MKQVKCILVFIGFFFIQTFLFTKITYATCNPPECNGGGASCSSNETCFDQCCNPTGGGGGGGTTTCFPAGTKVTLFDNTVKNIEDVKVGNKVIDQSGTDSQVVGIETPIRDNLCQINFESGKNLKLTSEHPIMAISGSRLRQDSSEARWSSISPDSMYKENPDLPVKPLLVGDKVIRENNIQDKVISISCQSQQIQTYNLLLGEGSHTYFADGVLVHNKAGKCPGGCCEGGPNYNVCGVCGNPACCNPNIWESWCSVACGGGYQSNQCGGTRACNTQSCCDVNAWGACSTSCGPGTQYNGCGTPRGCQINDPNAWSGWGGCSTSCGGGVQWRVNNCGTWQSQGCMVNNPNVWGPWSACSTTCGPGTQTRYNACGTPQSQSCQINDPNAWSGWTVCTGFNTTQTRTNACGTVQVNNCPQVGWWQVKDSDVSSNSDLMSRVPPAIYFNLDGSGGYPGVVNYGGYATLRFGGGTIGFSTTNWLANTTATSTKIYDSKYFANQIPADTIINDSSLFASLGGVASHGYYWYRYDGTLSRLDFTITSSINIGNKKVVLLVDNANLQINGNINLTKGQGLFVAVVDGNILISPTVGGGATPNLEGLYIADGVVKTGTGGAQTDSKLYVRGSVAGYGGVIFERDLGAAANATNPGELFEYAPDQIMTLLSSDSPFGIRKMNWKEVAP